MISSFRNRRIMAALSTNVSAVAPWWLAGGIPATNCIAAYQPKGAASLAASYDNLAAPGNGLPDGTYDAALGSAPTWNSVSGWIFDGETQYLNTGIIPGETWTAIMRFSNRANNGFLFGEGNAGAGFAIAPDRVGSVRYFKAAAINILPSMDSGTVGMSNVTAYRNGVAESTPMGAWSTTPTYTMYIGHANGGIRCAAYIQAHSIYNIPLSPSQMLALHTAMAAL